MHNPAESWPNRRVDFTRLSDARIFRGWVQAFSVDKLTLRCSQAKGAKQHDLFQCRVYAEEGEFVFEAQLTMIDPAYPESKLILKVASAMRQGTPTVEPRMRVNGGHILVGEEQLKAKLRDVSAHGVGVVTDFVVRPGLVVPIAVQTKDGVVEILAEARYCRPVPGDQDRYLVGFLLQEENPLVLASWSRAVVQRAA